MHDFDSTRAATQLAPQSSLHATATVVAALAALFCI